MGPEDNRDVGQFHQKFGLDNVTHGGLPGPRPWNDELIEFRTKFMEEELTEFKDAVLTRDHVKMFDALIDLVYVAHGTAHLLGYPWAEGWDEVHKANMKKVRAAPDGSDSARQSSLDVVKPEGWVAPDLTVILANYKFFVCPGCKRTYGDKKVSCTPEHSGPEGAGAAWCQAWMEYVTAEGKVITPDIEAL